MLSKKVYKGAIVGMGGLGCPALICLIESWKYPSSLTLDIYDGDTVELSNLNRQILFTPDDLGKNKAEVATRQLSSLIRVPEHINLHSKADFCTKEFIEENFYTYDFILDCTDSIPVKLALNATALAHAKILIYAGVEGYNGTAILIHPSGPCLESIFGTFSDEQIRTLGGTCQEAGIVGGAAGLLASLQVELLLSALQKEYQFQEGVTEGYLVNNSSIRKKTFTRIVSK